MNICVTTTRDSGVHDKLTFFLQLEEKKMLFTLF